MLFKPLDKDAFAQTVLRAAQEADLGPLVYDPAEFSLKGTDRDVTVHLGNVFAEYRAARPWQRNGILAGFMCQFQGLTETLEPSAEEARAALRPRIRERAYFGVLRLRDEIEGTQRSEPPFRELGGGHLTLEVVLGRPDTIRSVSAEHLADWGLTFEDALAIGNENLLRLGTSRFQSPRPGLFVSAWRDVYNASRLHLGEVVTGLPAKGCPVAMVPNRNTLIVTGADLIDTLNAASPWLIGSLIHKFGGKEDGEEVGDIAGYLEEMRKSLPADFRAKGDVFVFVDECHRTQSGELHRAMTNLLPGAMFIGFTGTPLLKADKQKSIEIFGRYIHTYKFDEAVGDKVVLDLRYEARDIDQDITSQKKIDQWFEAKTKGLTDLAKAQLKQCWGTMQKVMSSQDRLEKIVEDILFDFATRDRLMSGRGNAMLVSGSIFQACKLYELFAKTDLAGKCAIVTSYKPAPADVKGEETGEGLTEKLRQYGIYQKMMADWFGEVPERAVVRIEEFEKAVKKKFIEEPGQMKLLIVVDKLLTGFDAPPATYLYIDKQMRDHGLFQAICRVNRLDGDDKEYGYIVDYKDLFKSLETSIHDYTSGALDGYDAGDVKGLLMDRLGKGHQDLEDAWEAVKALCEPVEAPRDTAAYLRYFCGPDSGNAAQLKENEPNRLALYKLTAALIRAFANLANELDEKSALSTLS